MAFARHESTIACFDVQWISCFQHEKEVLFFGGDSVLRIRNIKRHESGSWRSFAKDITALQSIYSLLTGSPLPTAVTFQIKDIVLSMLQSVLDNDFLEYVSMSPYIKSLLHHQLYSAPNHIELDLSILMADYGFLSSILMKNSYPKQTLLNFVNLSELTPLSQQFTIVVPKDFMATEEVLNSTIDDILRVSKRRSLSVKFQWMRDTAEMNLFDFQSLPIPPNISISKQHGAISVVGSFKPDIPLQTVTENDDAVCTDEVSALAEKHMAEISGFMYNVLGTRSWSFPDDIRRVIFNYCALEFHVLKFPLTDEQLKVINAETHLKMLTKELIHFGQIRGDNGYLKFKSPADEPSIKAIHTLEKQLGVLLTTKEISQIRQNIRGDDVGPGYQMKVLELDDCNFFKEMMNVIQSGTEFVKHNKGGVRDKRYVLVHNDRLYWKEKKEEKNKRSVDLFLR